MKTFFLKLLDYRYVVNLRTKEIHRIDSKRTNCFLKQIKRKAYIKGRDLEKYILRGCNGCRWCMKEFDTDIYLKR